ncbi:MAG: membrane protein insertion efficiency factor YidD [Bacteroidales bacterium]|nr:membrane protein insertion efficiency factor YidD [Bacteroidales bacterium]
MNKSLIPVLILFFIAAISSHTELKGQSKDDILLLKSHDFENKKFNDRNVKYGFDNAATKNPVTHILSSSMYVYQKFVSPMILRSCAYSPTCSAYSKALIKRYGTLRGIVFTSDRLMRCNRIALAGKDISFFDVKTGKHKEGVNIYSLKSSKKQ